MNITQVANGETIDRQIKTSTGQIIERLHSDKIDRKIYAFTGCYFKEFPFGYLANRNLL